MSFKGPTMYDTWEGHRSQWRHRGEDLSFRHTCLLNDVSYIRIVRHNDLDIKNVVTTNNQVREI